MDLPWRIVFGLLGTGVLAYVGWFIFLLNTEPRAVWEMNNLTGSGRTTWRERFSGGKLVLIFLLTCFAAFEVAYWLLAWVPENWGKVDEYGEWEPARRGMSVAFAIIGGFFLSNAVGRGIKARLLADELLVDQILRDEVDRAYSAQGLESLRQELEVAASDGVHMDSYFDNGYLDKVYRYHLPPDVQRELFVTAMGRIDDRLQRGKINK
tara:strand:- start:7029 stop:7655 length:627 start_codon:yes stop_codon:yes gene_type:complete